MRTTRIQLVLIWISAILAANVLLQTGLAEGGGRLYSSESAYRRQTDALCRGELAISENPADLGWDMAWFDGSVHQVWGLGVPLWRVPWELAGRACGLQSFPDRISLGLAIGLVSFVVLRSLVPSSHLAQPMRLVSERPAAFASVLLLLLFPPFLALCSTRFFAYEEAAAYAYLVGILLLASTMHAANSSTRLSLLALSTVAGFAPFVRPTLLAYSMASLLVVASRLFAKKRKPFEYSLLAGPFLVGVGLLLTTNNARFGSPLEFGHSVNLNTLDPMRYVTRFGSPFESEGLLPAARELFACLFLTEGHFNGRDWYKLNFFPGQASTLRWREFYFSTFDLSYFILVTAGWLAGGWRSLRGRAVDDESPANLTPVLTAWSFLAVIVITFFYLRFPSVSSRYNMDYAPAFCAAIMVFLFAAQRWMRRQLANNHLAGWALSLLLVNWLGTQWSFTEVAFPTIRPVMISSALAEMAAYRRPTRVDLPDAYDVRTNRTGLGLPFHGAGWDPQDGSTKAAVTIWVENPQYLEVVVKAIGKEASHDPGVIRAKIGLEHLRLISMRRLEASTVLRFSGPQQEVYQDGLQVVYLGMVPTEEVSELNSSFKLLRVSWGREEGPPVNAMLEEQQ